jgi:hypothetical protein
LITLSGVVGAAVGLTIGVGPLAADPTTSVEYHAAVEARENTLLMLNSVRDRLDQSEAELEQTLSDLPAREAAVDKAERGLDIRKSRVEDAERDVARREKAVGIVERTIERNTIPGDGMFKVGTDMKPGTYKTAGHVGCYYAVLNSTDTFDIAVNNNINGPGFATVAAGQYFETTRCADWVLQH